MSAGKVKLQIPMIGSHWLAANGGKYEVFEVTNLHMAEDSTLFVPTVVAVPLTVPDVRMSVSLDKWHEMMALVPCDELAPVTAGDFDFDGQFNLLEDVMYKYISTIGKFHDMRRRADLNNLCNAMLTNIATVNSIAIQLATAANDAESARLRLELTTELRDLIAYVKTYKRIIKPLNVPASRATSTAN
jgi:hypothetical protein